MSTIAGEQPQASSTLAVKFMTTVFVMHCTSGAVSRVPAKRRATMAAEKSILTVPSLVRARAGSTGLISADGNASAPLVRMSGYALRDDMSKPLALERVLQLSIYRFFAIVAIVAIV